MKLKIGTKTNPEVHSYEVKLGQIKDRVEMEGAVPTSEVLMSCALEAKGLYRTSVIKKSLTQAGGNPPSKSQI